MATLVANNVYLSIGGVNVSAYFTGVKPKAKNNVKESTAGAGATHVQRQAGLDDYGFDFTLVYDSANLSTYIQQLKPGTVEPLDMGLNGNTVGQPRHTQSIIVESVSAPVKVDKDLIAFEVSVSGAAAPTNNMYAGATW